jgi:hypothetical protein
LNPDPAPSSGQGASKHLTNTLYILAHQTIALFLSLNHYTMAEHQTPPTHPIAPRLKGLNGDPKPYIGPTIDDYKKAHAATVGEGSDAWWAKVLVFSSSPLIEESGY